MRKVLKNEYYYDYTLNYFTENNKKENRMHDELNKIEHNQCYPLFCVCCNVNIIIVCKKEHPDTGYFELVDGKSCAVKYWAISRLIDDKLQL